MASKRVACAPTFRGVRGPLALVVLGVEIDRGEDAWVSLALVSKSTYNHEAENKNKLVTGHTLFFLFCSFGKVGIRA